MSGFKGQITEVATRARQRMGWILRVFNTRDEYTMMTLYRSLVLPLLEYCCQVWNPKSLGMIRQLEAVQRTFTHRISGISHLNYWQRLTQLKMYSLERRRERYIIIYTWKILECHVPNIDGPLKIQARNNDRRGRSCQIPPVRNQAMQRIASLRENSFGIQGPRLFNCRNPKFPRGSVRL